MAELPALDGYGQFLAELKTRIRAAQLRASMAVNRELVLLYWHIGRDILARQQRESWGAKVIDRLGRDLKSAFPEMKGFSPRNLKYMRAFGEAWPDEAIVQAVLAQITWYHNIAILEKLATADERIWYAKAVVEHGWSRNVLVLQIESGRLQRQGKAVANFDRTLPAPQSDLAFVGSQYRLGVGDQEFFVDLLFYHLKLRAYVVIDLKMGSFEPEFAGKMNFYLSAVDDLLRHAHDQPSIGLILCKTKDRVVAEYALRGIGKPIGISDYQLAQSLPEKLQGSLPTIEELESEFGGAEEA